MRRASSRWSLPWPAPAEVARITLIGVYSRYNPRPRHNICDGYSQMAEAGSRGEMTAFVRSVELGGFSAAARELRLTPSALSKLVSRLETRLGVRLLSRTTRRLALT